jgi:hypothetical protein
MVQIGIVTGSAFKQTISLSTRKKYLWIRHIVVRKDDESTDCPGPGDPIVQGFILAQF